MADVDGDGLTARDRRWLCLNQLTELLYEGRVKLEDLVSEMEKDRNPNPLLLDGFSNKSKRSPRTRRIGPYPVQEAKPVHNPTQMMIKFKNFPAGKPAVDHKKSTVVECLKASTLPCKRKNGGESESPKSKPKKAKPRLDPHLMTNIPNLEDPVPPEPFLNHISRTGGQLESLVFVIEKDLFTTDVSESHARLSVPYCQVKNGFLTSAEADELRSSSSQGVRVALIQPCLEECSMMFKLWHSTYVLNDGWKTVCSKNSLAVGKKVRLWAFRRNLELCFAMVEVS